MGGKGISAGEEAAFQPEASGVLNAAQTLRLLALPDAEPTPEELGAEALHNATVRQLPMGVAYAARDGTFIWCNAAFDRMMGLEHGEHKNKSIRELTHAADVSTNEALLSDLWDGRIPSYTLEKRYVRRDGQVLWVNVTAAMIRTPDGAPVCTSSRSNKWSNA